MPLTVGILTHRYGEWATKAGIAAFYRQHWWGNTRYYTNPVQQSVYDASVRFAEQVGPVVPALDNCVRVRAILRGLEL